MAAMSRLLVLLAGLAGALGVASAAAAAHVDAGRNLGVISTICLAHGPALLALGLWGRSRVLLAAAGLLALGTALFCGDLAMRQFVGAGLFPGAAPLGGGIMLLGWLGIGLGGVIGRR